MRDESTRMLRAAFVSGSPAAPITLDGEIAAALSQWTEAHVLVLRVFHRASQVKDRDEAYRGPGAFRSIASLGESRAFHLKDLLATESKLPVPVVVAAWKRLVADGAIDARPRVEGDPVPDGLFNISDGLTDWGRLCVAFLVGESLDTAQQARW